MARGRSASIDLPGIDLPGPEALGRGGAVAHAAHAWPGAGGEKKLTRTYINEHTLKYNRLWSTA